MQNCHATPSPPVSSVSANVSDVVIKPGYRAYGYAADGKIVHAVRNAPYKQGVVQVAPACEDENGPRIGFNWACPGEEFVTCLGCMAVLMKV